MVKNIVLLSDGTGNSSAKLFKTNVWRLHQALDLTDPDRQVAYYDNGVGTSSFKPLAILGGIFGFGLKRNVLDIYKFACRAYKLGDRIFGFGFSRGAFTMRVVASLIAREGLVQYDGDEAQLARSAVDAYRAYRKRFNITAGLVGPLRAVRDWLTRRWRCLRGLPERDPHPRTPVDKIHFLGLWDTVDAYGGPIEEIVLAIDYWFWPLSMPDRFMHHKVNRACHALALEDEREAFRPVVWDERYVSLDGDGLQPVDCEWSPPNRSDLPAIDRQRISQVWFAGVHSDIGGGYPQDGLSYFTLDWMIDRALVYDLMLIDGQRQALRALANRFDKLNDSRHGLSGYYRYRPRKLAEIYSAPVYRLSFTEDLQRIARMLKNDPTPEADRLPAGTVPVERPAPMIHDAVFERITAGTDAYAPFVLPRRIASRTRPARFVQTSMKQPTRPRVEPRGRKACGTGCGAAASCTT